MILFHPDRHKSGTNRTTIEILEHSGCTLQQLSIATNTPETNHMQTLAVTAAYLSDVNLINYQKKGHHMQVQKKIAESRCTR